MKLNSRKARIILAEKGWQIKNLAEETGISYQNICQYFGGTMTIGWQRLTKIANALGVPVEELTDETESAEQKKEIQVLCPHCGKPIIVDITVKK